MLFDFFIEPGCPELETTCLAPTDHEFVIFQLTCKQAGPTFLQRFGVYAPSHIISSDLDRPICNLLNNATQMDPSSEEGDTQTMQEAPQDGTHSTQADLEE